MPIMKSIRKEKCHTLERKLKNQRLEISKKSSEITNLEDTNSRLDEQVQSKMNEVARLLEEKSQLKDLVNDLEKTAEEHDQATARFRSELDSQKNQITHLQDTVKKFQSENEGLSKDYKELLSKQRMGRLESLEKESKIDQLEKKTANDEETISFLRGEITRLEKSKTDLKNQVDQIKTDSMHEVTEITKKFEELQKTNQRIQRQNSSLQNNIDTLEKTYDSQVESAESLQAELNQAKRENLELINQQKDQAIQIEKLQQQINDQERENNELLNENQGLGKDLNESKRNNKQKIISEKLQEYLQENNSKDSTYTGLDSTPDSAPNSAPDSAPDSAPNSPPQKLKIDLPALPNPITPGTTGTITENVPVDPVVIDSEKITNEDTIPHDASKEVPVNDIKPDSNSTEQCTDGTNIIDSADVPGDPNSRSESESSDSELIEEAFAIESTDSEKTSSNSNSTVGGGIHLKSDFNNSNSKVSGVNVDDELDILALEEEVIAEKPETITLMTGNITFNFGTIGEKPETSKKVLRTRSAPFNQEPPTSSRRSLRAKRSIRNESFNLNFSSL